jgi:hypothetical protein
MLSGSQENVNNEATSLFPVVGVAAHLIDPAGFFSGGFRTIGLGSGHLSLKIGIHMLH